VTLVATDAAIRETSSREENQRAVEQLFGDRVSGHRPLCISIEEYASYPTPDLIAVSESVRATMAAAPESLSEAYRRYEWLALRQTSAFAAEAALNAGFTSVDAASFDLAQGTLEDAVSTQAWALEQQRELAPVLERFEVAASRRLASGLSLAGRLLPGGVLPPEDVSCIDAFNAAAAVMPHVHDLRRTVTARDIAEQNRQADTQQEQLDRRLSLLASAITHHLKQIEVGVGSVTCPAAFSAETMTVSEWCGLSSRQNGPQPSATDVIGRLWTLYVGLLGRLSRTALEAEAAGQAAPRDAQ